MAIKIGRVTISSKGISVAPKTSPKTGDSSSIQRGSGSSGNSFVGPPPRTTPSSSTTTTTTTPRPSRGGGGGGSVTQTGGMYLTEAEASTIKNTIAPTTVVVSDKPQTLGSAVDSIKGGGTRSYSAGTNLSTSYGGAGDATKIYMGTTVSPAIEPPTGGVKVTGYNPMAVGNVPEQKPILPTIKDKIAYYYTKADEKYYGGYLPSGITPAELSARNNAQKNAEQYSELIQLSSGEIANLATDQNAKQYFSWGGNTYNPSTVQKALDTKLTEEITTTYNNEVKPIIDNKISSYQNSVNDLQARINSGELTLEDAKKIDEENYKNLQASLDKVDKDWQEGRGKYLIDSANKISRQVANVQNLKATFSAGKVAVLAGTSAIAGAGLVRLGMLATKAGAIGTVAKVGLQSASIFGYGGLAVGAGSTGIGLFNQYQKQGSLTGLDVASAVAPIVGYTIIGIGAGYAGAKVATLNQQKLINLEAQAFSKQLAKSEALQKQYLTEKNIKQGYFIKEINGRQIKFDISQKYVDALNRNAIIKKYGTTTKSDFIKVGTETRTKILDDLESQGLLRGVKIDESSVAMVRQTATSPKLGDIGNRDMYLISGKTTQNGVTKYVEFLVQYTKTGGVKNVRVYAGEFNEQTGLGIFEVGKVIKNPKTAKIPIEGQNPLESTTYVVQPQGRYSVKGKTTIRDTLFTESGKIIQTSESVSVSGKLRYATGTKAEGTNLFGGKEPILEFIQKPQTTIYNPKNVKVFDLGRSQRIQLIQNNKGVFIETGTSGRINKPFKLDFSFDRTAPPKVDTSTAGGSTSLLNTQGGTITTTTTKPLSFSGSALTMPTITPPRTTNVLTFTGASAVVMPQILPIAELSAGSLLLKKDTIKDRGVFAESLKITPKAGLLSPLLNPKVDTKIMSRVGTAGLIGTNLGVGLFSRVATATALTTPLAVNVLKPITTLKTPNLIKPIQDTPFFGLPTLPNLGAPETGGGQRGGGQRGGLFGKTTYNPSLGSILLRTKAKKVTSAEYESLGKQKFSGLGLRPELEIVDKKKKKKNGLGLF